MTNNCKPSGGKASTITADSCSQSSAWRNARNSPKRSAKSCVTPRHPTTIWPKKMADVIICLHLLRMMYGITDKAIRDRVEAKTIRLVKRMEES